VSWECLNRRTKPLDLPVAVIRKRRAPSVRKRRLSKFFKTGAAFWMNIQARYDHETTEDVLAPQIRKIAAYKAA
jgi:hypothetical protein